MVNLQSILCTTIYILWAELLQTNLQICHLFMYIPQEEFYSFIPANISENYFKLTILNFNTSHQFSFYCPIQSLKHANISGIFFVLPCIESYQKVDLRTITLGVPPQEVLSAIKIIFLQIFVAQVLTKDSVTVSVDAVVYYRVSNATVSVANVENAHHSTRYDKTNL